MFDKHHLRIKLSDLEFTEELSALELEAVTGGAIKVNTDKLVGNLLKNLRKKRDNAIDELKKDLSDVAGLDLSDIVPEPDEDD